jgi:hypothetical protein
VALSPRSYGRSTETAEAHIRNQLFTVRRKLSTATLVRARVTQAALHMCVRLNLSPSPVRGRVDDGSRSTPFLARIGARDCGAVTITPA